MTKISGWPGTDRSEATRHARLWRSGRRATARRAMPPRPHTRSRSTPRSAHLSRPHPGPSIASIGVSSSTSTPIRSSEGGQNRRVSGKPGQQPRPSLDQQDAGGPRVDMAEIPRESRVGELGQGSGHLDAGRAGPDQNKSQQPVAQSLGPSLFGPFEGKQHAAPDQGGVVDRFEAGRQPRPVDVAEIVCIVTRWRGPASGSPAPSRSGSSFGATPGRRQSPRRADRGVALMAQDGPDRLGDSAGDSAAVATWYKSGWKR